MAVTETVDALGSWQIPLLANTPKALLQKLQYFGHICIDIGNSDDTVLNDNILKTARYVGVLRDKDLKDTMTISGVGMAMWLGDEDQKGYVIESPLVLTGLTFQNAMRAILPPSLSEGTFFGTVAGTMTTTFQYTDPRTAADYITSTMGAEWRVNGDATVDAGLVTDLYRQTPIAALVRQNAGQDMTLKALAGIFEDAQDVEDFTTRVLLLGQGDAGAVLDATADIAPGLNPFKDMRGNFVKLTRMVSESTTDATNAPARAQLQLNRFTGTRDALTLSTTQYDIKGDIKVGDNIYVYDPDTGLIDETHEVIFRGERLNPLILRCTELSWPIVQGMIVGFRDGSGVWYDLTQYIDFETGQTNVVVGGYDRSLVSTVEPVGTRPIADTSVPAAPTWNAVLSQTVYQSPINGLTKAQVELSWNVPTNTDGSTILDGDHYEIRYRNSTTPIFPVTHAQMAVFTHAQLAANGGTFAQPIQYALGNWQTQTVGFDSIKSLIQELTPSMPYQAQIRAVDSATPPNAGAWSTVLSWQTTDDIIPPLQPAAPIIASNMLSLQVTHNLGTLAAGDFSESLDLHHLEVHGANDPTFVPSATTLVGKLIANAAMILGHLPVVGTFQTSSIIAMYYKVIAVDNAGNKSNPSPAASSSATLISDQYITNLTASKITAGTITAALLMSGSISTGATGARVVMDATGIHSFNSAGAPAVSINNDGSTSIVLSGDIKMPVGGHIKDGANDIILSADGISGVGLSTPFINVPLYKLWNHLTDNPAQYDTIQASDIAAEVGVYHGHISQVIWPLLHLDFLAGRGSGSTSGMQVRLYLAGTLVYTSAFITGLTNIGVDIPGIIPLLGFGTMMVGVDITVASFPSSADTMACSLNSLSMTGQ